VRDQALLQFQQGKGAQPFATGRGGELKLRNAVRDSKTPLSCCTQLVRPFLRPVPYGLTCCFVRSCSSQLTIKTRIMLLDKCFAGVSPRAPTHGFCMVGRLWRLLGASCSSARNDRCLVGLTPDAALPGMNKYGQTAIPERFSKSSDCAIELDGRYCFDQARRAPHTPPPPPSPPTLLPTTHPTVLSLPRAPPVRLSLRQGAAARRTF
jgi:hypothetical protein